MRALPRLLGLSAIAWGLQHRKPPNPSYRYDRGKHMSVSDMLRDGLTVRMIDDKYEFDPNHSIIWGEYALTTGEQLQNLRVSNGVLIADDLSLQLNRAGTTGGLVFWNSNHLVAWVPDPRPELIKSRPGNQMAIVWDNEGLFAL